MKLNTTRINISLKFLFNSEQIESYINHMLFKTSIVKNKINVLKLSEKSVLQGVCGRTEFSLLIGYLSVSLLCF